ncbi:MAG: CapA family protein [Deltaproteobacteria bacterium]|nr:CapA family protein [Deltaproteobacteria bacterium]
MPRGDVVRVIFLGDIMTHGQQLKYARTKDGYDFTRQFARIKPFLRKAMVVGNLETTFSGAERKFTGFPSFNTPDELADALVGLGVHVLTLANNHMLDRGVSGIERTVEVLNRHGIHWTGISDREIAPGQPLLVEYGGLRWAMVNFTYGSNSPSSGKNERGIALNVISEEGVRASVRAAKALNPDVTVALFHWGNEYQYRPAAAQVKTAELAAAEGADLVIGTHPHVLQPITIIPTDRGRTLVAYSLGNFIANQIKVPRERAAVLAVEFEKLPEGGARLMRASVAPTFVSSSCQKGAGCTIQLLYGGKTPEPVGPEPVLPPEEVRDSSVPDEEGEQLHSLLLYDSPVAGALAVAAVPAAAHAGEVRLDAAAGLDSSVSEVTGGTEPDAGTGEAGADGKPRKGAGSETSDAEGDGLPPLPEREIGKAISAGEKILEFLGARGDPDEYGYYTVWDASAPEELPAGNRKSPG